MTVQFPQGAFNTYHKKAFAGMVGRSDQGMHRVSRITDNAVVPGRAYAHNNTDRGRIRAMTATADATQIEGIVEADQAFVNPDAYAAKSCVNVVRRGYIWVVVQTGQSLVISATSPVYVVCTGADAGTFRGTADASAVLLAQCKVVEPGTVEALIECHFPI